MHPVAKGSPSSPFSSCTTSQHPTWRCILRSRLPLQVSAVRCLAGRTPSLRPTGHSPLHRTRSDPKGNRMPLASPSPPLSPPFSPSTGCRRGAGDHHRQRGGSGHLPIGRWQLHQRRHALRLWHDQLLEQVLLHGYAGSLVATKGADPRLCAWDACQRRDDLIKSEGWLGCYPPSHLTCTPKRGCGVHMCRAILLAVGMPMAGRPSHMPLPPRLTAGGYLEVSAIMPGDDFYSGFWPATWMMGNLGRAGAPMAGSARNWAGTSSWAGWVGLRPLPAPAVRDAVPPSSPRLGPLHVSSPVKQPRLTPWHAHAPGV